MARYARIADGRVAEIINLNGVDPAEAFHPDIAATIVPAGADVEIGWSYEDGAFSAPSASPPPTKAELVAYAATSRWRAETGGIEVSGQTIDTSRKSQNMIAGADALAQADPNEPVDYKAASGWVTLDAAAIHALALAVGRHVRSCFRKEREVVEAIETGQIMSAAEVDAAYADLLQD